MRPGREVRLAGVTQASTVSALLDCAALMIFVAWPGLAIARSS